MQDQPRRIEAAGGGVVVETVGVTVGVVVGVAVVVGVTEGRQARVWRWMTMGGGQGRGQGRRRLAGGHGGVGPAAPRSNYPPWAPP